jgi:hypothetical protein
MIGINVFLIEIFATNYTNYFDFAIVMEKGVLFSFFYKKIITFALKYNQNHGKRFIPQCS